MARHRWLDPLAAQIGMAGLVALSVSTLSARDRRRSDWVSTEAPRLRYRGCCRPAGSLGSPQREPPQLPTRRGARDGQLCWSATSVGGSRRAPKEDAGQRTAARAIRLPGKRSPRSMDEMRQGRRVHTLLIEDLVAERVADLHVRATVPGPGWGSAGGPAPGKRPPGSRGSLAFGWSGWPAAGAGRTQPGQARRGMGPILGRLTSSPP